MATAAPRGRGRSSSLNPQSRAALRKPGCFDNSRTTPSPGSLINQMSSVTLGAAGDHMSVSDISNRISCCQTGDKLELLVKELHNRSRSDRWFGHNFAVALAKSASVRIDGVTVRNCIFKCIQEDFDNKDDTFRVERNKFRNMASFLGDIFHHVRSTNGVPFTVLVKPVLSCLSMLTDDVKDEDATVFALQLQQNGSDLTENAAPDMDALMLKVREKIAAAASLSPCARSCLVLTLELYLTKWKRPRTAVQSLYTKLGVPSVVDRGDSCDGESKISLLLRDVSDPPPRRDVSDPPPRRDVSGPSPRRDVSGPSSYRDTNGRLTQRDVSYPDAAPYRDVSGPGAAQYRDVSYPGAPPYRDVSGPTRATNNTSTLSAEPRWSTDRLRRDLSSNSSSLRVENFPPLNDSDDWD